MVGVDSYTYAQWLITVGRSLRINPYPGEEQEPDDRSYTANFLSAEIGVRPWLWDKFLALSESLQGLVAFDNVQVQGRMVEIVGRNIMKIPIVHYGELNNLVTFMNLVGNRRYGKMGGGISPGTST